MWYRKITMIQTTMIYKFIEISTQNLKIYDVRIVKATKEEVKINVNRIVKVFCRFEVKTRG